METDNITALLNGVLRSVTAVAAGFVLSVTGVTAADYVPADYVWTTMSTNSSESMPCGGHDVGMNVWVEDGDVLFYLSKSGMFDENNTLLKAGRFRLKLSAPLSEGFTQTLCLDDGAIYIRGGGVELCLWADVLQPVVFIDMRASAKVDARLSYESWRYRDRPVTRDECQQCSWKWNIPGDCVTFADSITAAEHSVTFTHTNRHETVFDYTVTREQLDAIKDSIADPIGGRSFGGVMTADDFSYVGTTDSTYVSTDYRAWHYEARGLRHTTVAIELFTSDDPSWTDVTARTSRRRSADWWHAFWQRSFIQVTGGDTAKAEQARTAARNYDLFRYMLGCNAYGLWPTKFNGGLFTFDPEYVDAPRTFTPDYRCWGGGTMTAQNQRLVYWPMLKSGDTDMMASQLDTYLRMLPAAVARSQHYWGHDGASFCEQIENSGLPNPAEYGKHKEGDDPGNERNAWLEYQWDTALEFCSMALMVNSYTGQDISRYEEMIRQCVTFFDLHYQYLAKQRGVKALDGDGHLILYPCSGCETYKMAYNPSSVIAALTALTAQCEQYDTTLIDYTIKDRIPPMPLRTIDGDTCIAPAIVWARIQNVESPQLYPVFPWRLYGVGRPGIDIARNTYLKDPHVIEMRSAKGWKQDNIWAACLGLTDEAWQLNMEKFGDGPFRFPAFYDIGFDWTPDCNRAGAAMIGLQEMLLQETPDGELLLFPAWDSAVDVTFRLHATGGRIVEAAMVNGEIVTQ